MTLVAVDGTLGVVAKIADVDESAALELVRLGLYEALTEMIADARPSLDRDVNGLINKQSQDIRRSLVRRYVSKRLAGASTDGIIEAAAITVMGEVDKADRPALPAGESANTPDNAATPWWDARTPKGRFASRTFDALHTLSGTRPKVKNTQHTAAANQALTQDRYTALRHVGAGLSNIDHPGAKAVGTAAQVYGEMDDEARDIFERGIKRTAYRYRGTEKRPDKALKENIAAVTRITDKLDPAASVEDRASALSELTQGEVRPQRPGGGVPRSGGQNSPGSLPSSAVARFWLGRAQREDLSPDQVAMRSRGDLAVNYLRRRLPDMLHTRLSSEAGRIPPSQGVIIDADGDLVTEAMGYMGDHYVPFDLKNLGRLSGGQYVRTRAAGGPTTEDIYTGLMSNARQLQVISNSGVFTVEFDPDLRGGRRYSDKATQMVDRYRQLLKTIDTVSDGSGRDEERKIFARDIDDEEKHTLRERALRDSGGSDRAKADEIYREELHRARLAATYAEQDDTSMEAQAEEASRYWFDTQKRNGQPVSEQARIRNKEDTLENMIREARATKVRAYKLDGEGYATALEALRQEFPYYIRDTYYESLPDFLRQRGLQPPGEAMPKTDRWAKDPGYVKPNRLTFNDPGSKRDQRLADEAKKKPPDEEGAAAATGTPARPGGGGGAAVERPLVRIAPDPHGESLQELLPTPNSPVARKAAIALFDLQQYGFKGWESNEMFNDKDLDLDELIASAPPNDTLRWVLKQGEGNPAKAMAYLLEAAPEKVVNKVIRAVEQLKTETPDYPDNVGTKPPPEKFDQLVTVLMTRKPYAGPGTRADFAKRPDTDIPRPMLFPEINDLKADPARFEAYLEAAQKQRPGLPQAVEDIKNAPKPEEVINEAIDRYEAAKKWGGVGNARQRVPDDIDNEMARLATRGRGPLVERLEDLQVAWSWVIGTGLAKTLGGGERAPKEVTPGSSPEDGGVEKQHRRRVLFLEPQSPQAVELRKALLRPRRLRRR